MEFEKDIPKKMAAEFLGTMGLIIAVVGSVSLVNFTFNDGGVYNALVQGIAGAFVLFAMIEAFGKISGGHFNPAVTIAMIVSKDIKVNNAVFYIIAQVLGGLVGALLLLITFYEPSVGFNLTLTTETPSNILYLAISEFLCVFLLVLVVFSCIRNGSKKTSLAVGAFVGGMIMATASTFYANPAVDIARIFTNSACAISPLTSITYIVVAILAAIVAAFVMSWLYPKDEIVVVE